MAKFTDYTQKTKPADADLLLIHDNAGAANKKTPFSGVWSWILDKLASAVISQLETTNKSIIPAINELNSKILKTGTFDIAYGKTNTISRPSYLKDVLIVGGRLKIGFLIYFPRNSSEYYQVSNSGILESVSVDNENISLVLGAEGYGSSLFCSYIVL